MDTSAGRVSLVSTLVGLYELPFMSVTPQALASVSPEVTPAICPDAVGANSSCLLCLLLSRPLSQWGLPLTLPPCTVSLTSAWAIFIIGASLQYWTPQSQVSLSALPPP
eukprot:scaffold404700_cov16-Prasinocladus_malaysianus.AAC.1